jgi:uncharacterized membrane protein YebE (DUF533 family)
MKTRLIVPLILLMTVAVINANGQSIRKQSRNERERIAQGSRSGELTKHETARLAREQKDIRKDVRAAKADDGHIGPRERKHIQREERKASRHIYRAKHNNRTK